MDSGCLTDWPAGGLMPQPRMLIPLPEIHALLIRSHPRLRAAVSIGIYLETPWTTAYALRTEAEDGQGTADCCCA